jgi:DHA1 family tetracycline resistance protein-like MFS transporter
LFFTNFLYQSGFSFFVTFFSVFLILKFGFNQSDIGKFFAYVGLCISLSQAFLIGQVTSRFQDQSILKVALPAAALTVGGFLLVTGSWQFLILIPIFAGFNSLVFAIAPAMVSKSVDSTIQGEILGVNVSVQALAQAIPPVFSGFIAAKLTPEAPIFVAVCVMLLAGAVFYFFYKPVKVKDIG